MAEAKKTCFIITPIGDEGSETRRHIDSVCAVVSDALGQDWIAKPAHRIDEPGLITEQVYRLLYESELVVANLTGINPNVMYELAFRYAVGRPVIIIAQQGTKLPFDVQGDRVIPYTNDLAGAAPLKAALQDSVSNIDFEDATPRSPIHTLLASYRFEQQALNAAKNGKEKEALQVILQKFESLEQYMKSSKRTAPPPKTSPKTVFILEDDDESLKEAIDRMGWTTLRDINGIPFLERKTTQK